MRLAWIIGHNEKHQGAFSDYFGMTEFIFYTEVASKLKHGKVFLHDSSIIGYQRRMKATARRINREGFDLVLALHFNAAEARQANGVECLHYFANEKTKFLSQAFSAYISSITGVKVRNGGAKALVNKKDRGFGEVAYTKADTIILEPFFGTNDKDCALIGSTDNMATILNNITLKCV